MFLLDGKSRLSVCLSVISVHAVPWEDFYTLHKRPSMSLEFE